MERQSGKNYLRSEQSNRQPKTLPTWQLKQNKTQRKGTKIILECRNRFTAVNRRAKEKRFIL